MTKDRDNKTSRQSLWLPDDFDSYAWEVESKGCFFEAILFVNNQTYQISFYDPIRLIQEIKDDIDCTGVFFERNLVVVRSVTRTNMQEAVDMLINSSRHSYLVPR